MNVYSPGIAFVSALALALAATPASAHEDTIAPLSKVEKVYAAPKPLGELRVTYSGAGRGKGPGRLAVGCDAFRGDVPAEGLSDLPRPDWERFFAAYSLTSYERGKWTGRPYVYVQVPLNGPAGEAWERTWVTFHFGAGGKPIRRIKRFIPDEATNSVRVLWKDWKIGSGVSAERLLGSAKDE